jgi:hypothetical protein
MPVTNFFLGSLLLCSHCEFQFFSSHRLIIILPFPLVKTCEVRCSNQLENNGIVVLRQKQWYCGSETENNGIVILRQTTTVLLSNSEFHAILKVSLTCYKSATWDRWLAEDFFALKNRTASARLEPTNLGTRGQHANHWTTEATSVRNDCRKHRGFWEIWR